VKAIGARLTKNIQRLNQLNRIISPNRFMTEKLKQYGVLPKLIVQSAFGIDVPSESAKKLYSPSERPLKVGFIGTLAPHKGCHVLIKAFNGLPYRKAELSIYGKVDELPEYSMELKQLAVNNGGIKFCGTFHNSEIDQVLADLDVLVVPSLWYENTPLVIYSALGANCPVIASNYPSISEVIKDQSNGLLFEPGNGVDLQEKLHRLIYEPNLVTKLSLNCKQPKSISTYVDELLNIWNMID
jgi:glycosyltransferase involved in cell wall biosynthesis